MFGNVFQDQRVLVTGHTGFKGSWLSHWLLSIGAKVTGLSLPPNEDQTLFKDLELEHRLDHIECDIRSPEVADLIKEIKPNFVFHLAAQPLVSVAYEDPFDTYSTNVLGTINLLDGIRGWCNDTKALGRTTQRCAIVVVTTDKVYENRECPSGYREEDALGGHDPYSASKACVEIVASSYRRAYFQNFNRIDLATARAGNVIGGGDWSKNRIVPDCFRALKAGEPVPVRNKDSTRPWQHVLEPLSGYMWLAALLAKPSLIGLDRMSDAKGDRLSLDSINFGPLVTSNRSVGDLVTTILDRTGGEWTAQPADLGHEAGKLHLSIDKAYHLLKWGPTWNFEQTVAHTSDWYKLTISWNGHKSWPPIRITDLQIKSYHDAALEAGWKWAE